MILDKTQPYAETIGDSVARFHQNGRDFDANGELIEKVIAEVMETQDTHKRRGRPPKEHK